MKKVAVVLVLAGLLGGGGYWYYYSQYVSEDQYYRILEDEESSDFLVFGALVRLAQKGDEVAMRKALERCDDPSTTIRQGVADAVGYFEDEEAYQCLRKRIKDHDTAVRIRAIRAIGRKYSERRKADLGVVLAQDWLTDRERYEANMARIGFARTEVEKKTAFDEIVQFGLSGDSQYHRKAIERAKILGPDQPAVKALK